MSSSVEWDFDRSARALVEALIQVRAHNDQDQGIATLSSTSPVHLTSWVIEAEGGTSYLTHPPVLIRSEHRDGDCSRWTETEMISGEDKMMESSESNLELDESAAVYMYSDSNQYNITEWNFSIVFHAIWRVPTLYFSVHDIDGIPTTRDAVISILLDNTTNESIISEEQTWDFVSQEEHPVTGKPSFFLHPCQTATKMEFILNQPKHHSPLLSWMSMILPSVGCRISPIIFQQAQKQL